MGNIRELQHTIEKAVILSDDAELQASDFHFGNDAFLLNTMPETLEEMEEKMIREAMQKFNGNYTAVAGKLGITRPTLYNKMKKYGI